ncbi:MAG: class I SAM-dependent methyltransferase [Polyangiaceae bacterium]
MTDPRALNPTGRFTDRTDDYVKYRPSYPSAAIDAIVAGLEGSAAGSAIRAADVGAGTGISARLLAARGLSVLALEPNRAMREAAEPDPRITWRDGTAEATGLDLSSVDLVIAAQAFHWFRAAEALREFARILRPGGRIALLWNRRKNDDPFTAGYRAAILAVGAESAVERMEFDASVVAGVKLFSPLRRLAFDFEQKLDRAGLMGRARSASYVPKTGPDADKVAARLDELYTRYADREGLVTLMYTTEVYLAETLGG